MDIDCNRTKVSRRKVPIYGENCVPFSCTKTRFVYSYLNHSHIYCNMNFSVIQTIYRYIYVHCTCGYKKNILSFEKFKFNKNRKRGFFFGEKSKLFGFYVKPIFQLFTIAIHIAYIPHIYFQCSTRGFL